MAVNWNARGHTKEEFTEAWNSSLSIAEVARKLDCNKNGSGYSTLKRAATLPLNQINVDTSEINSGMLCLNQSFATDGLFDD